MFDAYGRNIHYLDVYKRQVHDLGKALDAGHAALELLGKLHAAADGGNEGGDVQHIGHHVTGGDPAVHQREACLLYTSYFQYLSIGGFDDIKFIFQNDCL